MLSNSILRILTLVVCWKNVDFILFLYGWRGSITFKCPFYRLYKTTVFMVFPAIHRSFCDT